MTVRGLLFRTAGLLHRPTLSGRSRLASACLGLALAGALLCASYSGAEAQPATTPIVLPGVEAIRGLAERQGARIDAVAELVEARQGSGVAIVRLGAALATEGEYVIAAPAGIAGLKRTRPTASIVLPSGDIVVVGFADVARGARTGQEAWAARVRADGSTAWSRTWPQSTSQPLDEYLYFARQTRPGVLLVGGKAQRGPDSCDDPASGLAFEIDAATGALVSQRRHFTGDGRRQGFRDVVVRPNGTLMFVGWIAETRKPGARGCADDAWVVEVSAARPNGVPRRQGFAGSDILMSYAGETPDGPAFLGYAQPDPARPAIAVMAVAPDGGTTIRFTQASPPGMIFSRGDVTAVVGQARMAVSLGQASPRDQRSGAVAWLRLHGADLRCGDDMEIAGASGAAMPRALALVQVRSGDLVVAGDTTESRSHGWVARLALAKAGAPDGHRDLGTIESGARSMLAVADSPAERRSLVATFALRRAGAVAVEIRPLGTGPVTTVLRDAAGTIVAMANGTADAPALITQRLQAGRHRLDVMASTAGQAFVIGVAPAADGRDLAATASFLTEHPRRTRLVAAALARLGRRTGIDVEIGAGLSLARSWQSFLTSGCRAGAAAANDLERLRLLYAAVARRAGDAGERARARWLASKSGPGVRRVRLLDQSGEEIGAIDVTGPDARGIRVGAITFRGRSIYEGELRIAESDVAAGNVRFNWQTRTGAGVTLYASGSAIAGQFQDGFLTDFGRRRGGDGQVFEGAFVARRNLATGGQTVGIAFGYTTSPTGQQAPFGDVAPGAIACVRDGNAPTDVLLACVEDARQARR